MGLYMNVLALLFAYNTGLLITKNMRDKAGDRAALYTAFYLVL